MTARVLEPLQILAIALHEHRAGEPGGNGVARRLGDGGNRPHAVARGQRDERDRGRDDEVEPLRIGQLHHLLDAVERHHLEAAAVEKRREVVGERRECGGERRTGR